MATAPFLGILTALDVDTSRTLPSPDGVWSLVVRSHNQGALGGDTYVVLRSKTVKWRYILNDGDWLNDSEVRWMDARTVALGLRLQTPFVEHSIPTGSAATGGARIDARGYVRNAIVPGERVALLSGLSVVLPGNVASELLTRREAAGGRPWQRLLPVRERGESRPGRYGIVTLRSAREFERWRLVKRGRLVARSKDREVEVRWLPADRSLFVIVDSYDRMTGVVSEQGVMVASDAEARARAARLWRALSIRGVVLPRHVD